MSSITQDYLPPKPQLHLKIFISQYQNINQPYDFNSTQPSQFKFQHFNTFMQQNLCLYFYSSKQRENVIVSTTMDCSNQLQLIFAMYAQDLEAQLILDFMNLEDIIKKHEKGKISQAKLASRLKANQNQKYSSNNQHPSKSSSPIYGQNYLKDMKLLKPSYQLPTYFYPLHKPSQPIYFVPRFMQYFCLQKDTQLLIISSPQIKSHFANKAPYKQNILHIKNINPSFTFQQVSVDQIQNNPQLHLQNQMNLIHFCEQEQNLQELQQNICVFCQESVYSQQNQSVQSIAVDLCYCLGSVKYKHLKCLTVWLNLQRQKYHSHQLLRCSECLRPWPQFIELTHCFNRNSKIKQTKYFHFLDQDHLPAIKINDEVIKLKSNIITIGSKQQCNYSITHKQELKFATIVLDSSRQKLFLKDEKSRWGVLARKDVMQHRVSKMIWRENNVAVLVGKRLFHFCFYPKPEQ